MSFSGDWELVSRYRTTATAFKPYGSGHAPSPPSHKLRSDVLTERHPTIAGVTTPPVCRKRTDMTHPYRASGEKATITVIRVNADC